MDDLDNILDDTDEEEADKDEEAEDTNTATEGKEATKEEAKAEPAKTEAPKKDEALEQAIASLKAEIAEKAEDTQLVVLGSNLMSDFKKDPELAKAYVANKQTLENIWEVIKDTVQKDYAKSGFAMLPDEQVYAMAREQCHLPPKPKEEPKPVVTKTEKTSKADKTPKSEDKPTKVAAKIMEKATKKVEKKQEKKDENEESLFDLLGIPDETKKA